MDIYGATKCKLPANVSVIGVMGACVAFCAAAMLNNLLIILVVWRYRTMHNPTNFLLSNNAFTEFVYVTTSTTVVCLSIYIKDSGQVFETNELKKISYFFLSTKAFIVGPFFITAINLTVLAVERYNALVNPMNLHRRLTKRGVTIVIFSTWIVTTIATVPISVQGMGMAAQRYYLLVTVVLVGAISLITIAICYGKIIYGICISKTIFREISSATTAQDIKDKKNVVKMLIANTLMFTVTRLPTMGYSMKLLSLERASYDCLLYVSLFGHMSAFCNPLMFILFSKNYRDNVKKMLSSCFKSNI